MSKTAGGVTTTYLVDDATPGVPPVVVEERIAGKAVRSYVYGHDLISEREVGSAIHYHHSDLLGSVHQLTSSATAVTDTYDYDAFGVSLHTSGTTHNEMRYPGERSAYRPLIAIRDNP